MLSATFPINNQVVRHEVINGDPWFHVSDVCKALDLSNSREIANRLEQESKRQLNNEASGSDPWFMDEEALYTVVLRCRDSVKPGTVAYQFRKWVIGVIKTIRKTGQYTATASDQQYFQPFGITLQRKLEECDKYLESASVGTGSIRKVLQDRSALERALKAEVKPAKDELAHLMQAWHDTVGTEPVTAKELVAKLSLNKTPKALGYYLRSNCGTRVGNMRIVKAPCNNNEGVKWILETL